MNDLKLEERLKRIEQLLVANKEVLTLEEACEYTGISRSYMYKLTYAGKIPHSKPRRKKELISIIEEMLGEFELEEIKLSLSDLQSAVRDSYYKVSISKINESVKEKWKLTNPNRSYYQYFKSINPGNNEWQISSTNKKGRCYTFKKEFIQGMLNC